MTQQVAYDSEIFVRQQRGGISRYFAEIIHEFASDPALGVHATLLFDRCSNQHLRESATELTFGMPALRAVPRGIPRALHLNDPIKDAFVRYRAGGRAQGPKAGPPAEYDWVHATYFRPMRADVARGRRLAVTIHDMIPERLGVDMKHGAHRSKHETLARADLILSISHATSRRLAELLPQTAGKTVVVPLGVSPLFLEAKSSPKSPVDFPYLLFVGSRLPYKRFDLLLAALKLLRSQGHDLGLVAAGEPLTAHEAMLVAADLPEERFVQLTPTDQDLAQLYAHAQAFVFPSELEGFGLPLLEALACGCPVVASDIEVFNEVGGECVRYFTPGSAEHLARVLVELLSDGPLLASLRTLGITRASHSTWRATAAATAAAYLAAS